MSFVLSFDQGEKETKRLKVEEEEEESLLSPTECALYAELNHRYLNRSEMKPIFDLAPQGLEDPKARKVLVALLNVERQALRVEKGENEALIQSHQELVNRCQQLEKMMDVLKPVKSILDESKGKDALIFELGKKLIEANGKSQELEQRAIKASTHWNAYYKQEMDKKRETAMGKMEAVHWEFLDTMGENASRDDVIQFMEKCRLIINEF